MRWGGGGRVCVCVCWQGVGGGEGFRLAAQKDETNEMSDVKKMNQPHSLKNVMAEDNGRARSHRSSGAAED